jgi:hypothetical protein
MGASVVGLAYERNAQGDGASSVRLFSWAGLGVGALLGAVGVASLVGPSGVEVTRDDVERSLGATAAAFRVRVAPTVAPVQSGAVVRVRGALVGPVATKL